MADKCNDCGYEYLEVVFEGCPSCELSQHKDRIRELEAALAGANGIVEALKKECAEWKRGHDEHDCRETLAIEIALLEQVQAEYREKFLRYKDYYQQTNNARLGAVTERDELRAERDKAVEYALSRWYELKREDTDEPK